MLRPLQSALDLARLLESLSPPPGAPPEWEAVRRASAAKARAAARTEVRAGVRRTVERPRLHKRDLAMALLGLLDLANRGGAHGVAKGLAQVIAAVQGSRIVGERRHG